MMRLKKTFWLVPVLLLLGAGIWAGLWAAKPIPQGVTINKLDVGGLSRWEARRVLREALEERLYNRALEVRLPKETLTFTPEESGVRCGSGNCCRRRLPGKPRFPCSPIWT